VTFAVRHLMVSTVRGRFNVLRGTLNIDETDLANSWVEAEVDVASIDTGDATRDKHLQNADFLEAATYPTMTFKSTNVEQVEDEQYRVTGDLTLHGVTKPAVFNVEYSGQINDPYGLQPAGFSAKSKISRKEWGLTWHMLLAAGGAIIGDEVKIEIDLEATKAAEPATVAA
jgi:polyisoprenoid-binding protein YceI